MKLANKTEKKKVTKTTAKVWAVRGLAIVLAALFVITGLIAILPVF